MNAPTRLLRLVVTWLLVTGCLGTFAFPVSSATARVMAPDPVVVVVESEFRRTDAAALRKAGHEKVVSLSGGLRAWRDANLPVEKSAA